MSEKKDGAGNHPGLQELAAAKPGDYKIVVVDYKIDLKNAPLGGVIDKNASFVHKEIVVLNDKNEPVMAFAGHAWDKKTGEFKGISYMGTDTLRATVNKEPGQGLALDITNIRVLDSGSKEDILDKANIGIAAAIKINEKNLTYHPIGISPTNSNSVAATVAKAMGFELPPNPKSVYSPGESQQLLSKEEISKVTRYVGDIGPERQAEIAAIAEEMLGAKAVGQIIKLESIKSNAPLPPPKDGMAKDVKMGIPAEKPQATSPSESTPISNAAPGTNSADVAVMQQDDLRAKLGSDTVSPREGYEKLTGAYLALAGHVNETKLNIAAPKDESLPELRRSAQEMHKLAETVRGPLPVEVTGPLEKMDQSLYAMQIAENPEANFRPPLGAPATPILEASPAPPPMQQLVAQAPNNFMKLEPRAP